MTTEYLGDKRELQAILETATNAAFLTGDNVFYNLPSVRKAKAELLEVIKKEKQGHNRTNGDYGGGGC